MTEHAQRNGREMLTSLQLYGSEQSSVLTSHSSQVTQERKEAKLSSLHGLSRYELIYVHECIHRRL